MTGSKSIKNTSQDGQQNLRRWYLARLRRLALLDRDTLLTPSRLMDVDKQHLIELAATSQIGSKRAEAPPFLSLTTQIVFWLCVAGILFGAVLAFFIARSYGVDAIFPIVGCQLLAVIGIAVVLVKIKSAHKEIAMSILGSMMESEKGPAKSLGQLAEQFAMQCGALVERERLIVDYAPDVLCLLDRQLMISCINPACAKLWGYIPAQLMRTNICDIIAGNDLAFKQLAEDAYKTAEERVVDTKLKTADGKLIDVRWTLEWSARHEQFFAIGEDVTAEMHSERIRNEFFSLIAHDLRSPIAAMDASLQLLEQGISLYESPTEQYSKMRQRTDYLLRLLNDVLDMNRVEESQIELLCEETSLKDMVNEAADLVVDLARDKQVECEVKADDARINVDRHRLKRVLVNLLVNAIKFSPEKSTVTIRATTERQTDVVIAVSDQGRGISEADRNRIFSKFEQVESSDAAIKGGAGLGLAICRTLVNAHKGTISVASEVGKGATFTIVLPDAVVTADAPAR